MASGNKLDIEVAVNVTGDQQVVDLGDALGGATDAAKAMGNESANAAGSLGDLSGGAGAAADDASALGNALDDTADAAQALQGHAQGTAAGMNSASSAAGALAAKAGQLAQELNTTGQAEKNAGTHAQGAAAGMNSASGAADALAAKAGQLAQELNTAGQSEQNAGAHAQGAAAGMNSASGAAGALAAKAGQLAQELNTAGQSEQNAGAHAQGAAAGMNSASGAADALAAKAGQLAQELNATGQAEKNAGTQAQGAASGMNSASGAADRLANESKKVSSDMKSVGEQLTDAKNQLLAFVGIQGLAESVKDAAALADAWKNMRARLQLALGAQTDVNKAMEDVVGVSQRTYSSLEATVGLYGKIASIGKDMGRSQQQALKLTETINQSIQLSGASAQASEASITQLVQSLQSGVLRGDEFNSIMEQSPRLAQALADGLNVPIGALRSMAEAGKLTSSEVIRALTNQTDVIEKEFGSLPITIGRAVQKLQTEWQKFVSTLDQNSGASGQAALGIQALSRHLDDLARIAAASGAAMLAAFAVQAVNALRLAAAEMAVTGGAAKLLALDLATLGKPVQIAIAVAGFEIGWQIGTMLRDNFALARQLGVGIVGFTELLLNDLKFLKDAAAAVFTDDTVSASFDRYKQRNIEISATLNDMFEDAKKAPGEIASAADKAAKSTSGVGDAATTVAQKMAYAGTAGAASMGQIGSAAETGRAALEALAAQINTRPATNNGIAQIVGNLTAAKLRADDVDKVLRNSLPEAISKLSGAELVKFRSEFLAAMDAAGLKGKELQTGLRLIAEQAAQSLGVDVPLATNKITKEFEAARGNLSVLIRSLPELKAAGVDTATLVAQAMAKMIDGAKSQAEIDSVTRQVKVLRDQLGTKLADGLLDQAKQKAADLSDALDKATPGINSLKEAMKELGLQSTASLKDAAKNASEAFDVIKAKGQEEGESYVAWQARKQDAARVMLERAIAANRGVADAATITKAAMEGLEIQTDSTGKSIVAAMDKGSDAAKGLGDAVQLTTEQIKAQEDAADRLAMKYKLSADYTERQLALLERENALVERRNTLERERLNIDKEGYSLNTAGQRVNAQSESKASIYERAKNAGLTEEQALKLSNETALPYNGPSVKVASPLDNGSNWSTDLQKKIDQLVLSNASANAGSNAPAPAAPAAAVAPAPAAATPAAPTYVTYITIPPAGQKKISTTDASSSATVNDLLRQLAEARGTAS